MRLCDRDIQSWINEGRLHITPYPKTNQISGVTVDLCLGNKFRTFNGNTVPFIDLRRSKHDINSSLEKVMNDEIEVKDGEVFCLHPGELVLAMTYESITLPSNLVGWLDGRSSLARLGLMIHVTAHRIDPGWSGQIVLEVFNIGKLSLALCPGMKIGALSFELLTGFALYPYNNREDAKYHNQKSTIISKINKDYV